MEKLDNLQKLRNAKLNKAQKLIKSINRLIHDDKEYKPKVYV